MIRRRVGRPGLLGTMARTAVITGTATAVAGGMQRNQQARAQQQTQQVPPVEPAQPPTSATDTVAQLAQLGELRQTGVLDDAEFAAAKAKLLGI